MVRAAIGWFHRAVGLWPFLRPEVLGRFVTSGMESWEAGATVGLALRPFLRRIWVPWIDAPWHNLWSLCSVCSGVVETSREIHRGSVLTVESSSHSLKPYLQHSLLLCVHPCSSRRWCHSTSQMILGCTCGVVHLCMAFGSLCVFEGQEQDPKPAAWGCFCWKLVWFAFALHVLRRLAGLKVREGWFLWHAPPKLHKLLPNQEMKHGEWLASATRVPVKDLFVHLWQARTCTVRNFRFRQASYGGHGMRYALSRAARSGKHRCWSAAVFLFPIQGTMGRTAVHVHRWLVASSTYWSHLQEML